MRAEYFKNFYVVYALLVVECSAKGATDVLDKAIEDEITRKLSEDLLQSVEKKFLVDLERSVNTVVEKIKLLIQNGTFHIQEKMMNLQLSLAAIKQNAPLETEQCLSQQYNSSSTLAEKALHQMVICGYALIGQDPSTALNKIVALKSMIRQGVAPLYEEKQSIYELLRSCGHEHDSLKKVIKCVISKSPIVKSVLMNITKKLIDGVVGLTKMLAHGAMHEACLIEVVKTIEDEAADLVGQVKKCINNETVTDDVHKNENKTTKNNSSSVMEALTTIATKNESARSIEDVIKDMVGDDEQKSNASLMLSSKKSAITQDDLNFPDLALKDDNKID